MSYFTNSEIDTLVDAEKVQVTSLIEARFASETVRVTEEGTPFTDLNGNSWQPGYGLISYDDASIPSQIGAGKRTYRIAAADASAALAAVMMESEYRDRHIFQYIQFFREQTVAGSDGTSVCIREPVGVPQFLVRHVMDKATLSVSPDGNATLTMECETLFASKNRAPYALLSQTDQRARYPGDAGLDRMPDLVKGKILRWPDY